MSSHDIDVVLTGDCRYDELAEREQAVVRDAWDARIVDRIAALDLRDELGADGGTWAETDVSGQVVLRSADSTG